MVRLKWNVLETSEGRFGTEGGAELHCCFDELPEACRKRASFDLLDFGRHSRRATFFGTECVLHQV